MDEEQRKTERCKTYQNLLQQQKSLLAEIWETKRRIGKAEAALKRLKEEEDKDKGTDPSGLFSFQYLFGYTQSLKEKEARERRRNERSTGRIVQEAVLHRETPKLATLVSKKSAVDEKIEMIQREESQEEAARWAEEKRRKEEEKQADLERKQAEARRVEEEWLRRARARAEELRAKEAMETQKREEKERLRRARAKAEEEELRAKEAMEKQQRAEKERLRKIRERRAQWTSPENWGSQYEADLPSWIPAEDTRRWRTAGGGARAASDSTCLHRGWWTQVDGAQSCHRCRQTTRHFAFRCPSCSMVACSRCRNILKG